MPLHASDCLVYTWTHVLKSLITLHVSSPSPRTRSWNSDGDNSIPPHSPKALSHRVSFSQAVSPRRTVLTSNLRTKIYAHTSREAPGRPGGDSKWSPRPHSHRSAQHRPRTLPDPAIPVTRYPEEPRALSSGNTLENDILPIFVFLRKYQRNFFLK